MTFRFNSKEFTKADVGRKLTCVATWTHYFTVGKTYPIVMDGNIPALRTDDGGLIHHSSSDFVFYNQQVNERKQPKAGEVWCFMKRYDDPKGLWVVRNIDTEDERVYIKNVASGYLMSRSLEGFIRDNTFVF